MPYRLLLILLLICSTVLPATAQEATDSSSADDADSADTTEASNAIQPPPLPDVAELDRMVDADVLRLAIKPLDAETVEEQAARWQGYLQEKQEAISAFRIEGQRAGTDDERDAAIAEAVKRELQRSELIDRLEVILNDLEAKGGDASSYRSYASAVESAKPDLGDVNALFVGAKTWLLSSSGGVEVAINIVQFVVILVLAWLLSKLLGRIAAKALSRVSKASTLLKEFLAGLVRKLTFVVGFVIALSFLGVNIAPLVAAIGAAGLVVGLALQGTLSNFASGILILLYRPYDVGDVIDAAGVSGTVEAMTLVSTTVLTFDNKRIIVPNNNIWGDVITNVTGKATRRVDMKFGIAYGDDQAKAERILRDIVAEHSLIHDEPEPIIRLHELADSSVNFIVRPWCNTTDYWKVYWEVTGTVKQRFDAEEINIPFPQRDVHVYRHDMTDDATDRSAAA